MPTDSLSDWGISSSFRDWRGRERRADPQVLREVRAAMGAEGRPPRPPVLAAFQDGAGRVSGRITLEGGDRLDARRLPVRDLPLGYHRLEDRQGERLLVVAPPACAPAPRAWGWCAQLYAVRSEGSCQLGDLEDLRQLAAWARGTGAAFVMLNPLHAPLPVKPQQASPYYPSSRRYRNPLYLRAQGQPPERPPLIDRDRAFEVKLPALEREFAAFRPGRDFAAYLAREGAGLEAYATFCAICERHGADRSGWPAGLTDPESAATAAFRARRRDRVDFHGWLQWRLEVGLGRAARELPLVHDLAVGVDPAGADAWTWGRVFAAGVRIGAPPDEFAATGQDWGLPPLDPWRLRAARYEPFIQTVRAALRHAGGIRMDHVMGLFRLWWIPPGREPHEGAYVRYPWRELLAILALESSRAGAFVIGEDLGTVQRGVRRALRRRGVLSYRLLWFEERAPRRFPAQALAAITTHDLPTVAGLWTGRDLEDQRAAGLEPNAEATASIRRRLGRLTRLRAGAPAAEVIVRAHAALAAAPSQLLGATLDDATAAEDRPNLPGTVDERPNWRLPLPLTLEQLRRADLPRRVAAELTARRPPA